MDFRWVCGIRPHCSKHTHIFLHHRNRTGKHSPYNILYNHFNIVSTCIDSVGRALSFALALWCFCNQLYCITRARTRFIIDKYIYFYSILYKQAGTKTNKAYQNDGAHSAHLYLHNRCAMLCECANTECASYDCLRITHNIIGGTDLRISGDAQTSDACTYMCTACTVTIQQQKGYIRCTTLLSAFFFSFEIRSFIVINWL